MKQPIDSRDFYRALFPTFVTIVQIYQFLQLVKSDLNYESFQIGRCTKERAEPDSCKPLPIRSGKSSVALNARWKRDGQSFHFLVPEFPSMREYPPPL